MNIVLASASQRRQELLKRIFEDFRITVSNFDEGSVNFNGDCGEYVKKLALGKAQDVANKETSESMVIGCDTIVYFNGTILGKPKDKDEAFSMLKVLSGNIHKVYSGIALVNSDTGAVKTDFVSTDVYFSKLSDKQILEYVASGEPMDKAGAYGIQGKGGIFVEKICGCYYNVVGLPLNRLYDMLKEMGVNL